MFFVFWMLCCCKSFATHFVGECGYFTECLPHYFNLLAALLQTVSSRRGRFIAPVYPYISTKWRTEMCLRWNEYTYLIMCKCVFGNGKIRARWIGPYAWRNVSWVFSWANVDISQNVCNLFFICMLHNRHTKVWFLPCKSMVFGVQKGGFYNAKRGFWKSI